MIRTELTGPWAGFGFQQGHLWTPEGHSIEPHHMAWMSLTANIMREWQAMMADARSATHRKAMRSKASNVVYLRDVLRGRREQQEQVSNERLLAGIPDNRAPLLDNTV